MEYCWRAILDAGGNSIHWCPAVCGRDKELNAVYQSVEYLCLAKSSTGDCLRKYSFHCACVANQHLRQRHIQQWHSRCDASGHHCPVFDSDSHGRIHFTPPSGQYRPGSSLRRHNVIVASSTRRKYLRGYDIRLRLARGSSHHRCRIRCHMAVRICGESDRRRNKKRQVVCSCSIRGTSLIAPRIRPTLGIFRRHTHTSSRSRCGFVPRFHP